MSAVIWVLRILQILSCAGIIALVMSQTTKSEGLSGTIGGKMTSSFRGKPGIDEKLADITKWTAVAFFVLSLLVYIFTSKATV